MSSLGLSSIAVLFTEDFIQLFVTVDKFLSISLQFVDFETESRAFHLQVVHFLLAIFQFGLRLDIFLQKIRKT